jgi:hypothetical protein
MSEELEVARRSYEAAHAAYIAARTTVSMAEAALFAALHVYELAKNPKVENKG